MGLYKLKGQKSGDLKYLSAIKRAVKDSDLDRAVLLAFDETYNHNGSVDNKNTYMYVSNDYAKSVCNDNKDLFLFGASVHPFRPDALDELDRVKAEGAVLVKLLPGSQGFNPADRQILPYYRRAAKLKLPLLIHCGYEHTIPVTDQKYGDPLLLRPALDEGVTVIIAHGGSSGRLHFKETFGDSLKLLNSYDNCYADNSSLTNLWRSKYLLWLLNPDVLEHRFGVSMERPFDRFLHGSDYPIPVTPYAFWPNLKLTELKEISRIQNPFDLDIILKKMLGVPDICMHNVADVLLDSAHIGKGVLENSSLRLKEFTILK
jgi:predicted TIM-barrel fold metal-dependent hydrolase